MTVKAGSEAPRAMCFSATANFAVGATTAVIGIAALKHVTSRNELPLALVPLLFAAQQFLEGLVWLRLEPGGNGQVSGLAFSFLIFAEVVWPVYAAVAVLLIEPVRWRRLILGGLAIGGGFLSTYLLAGLVSEPVGASIQGHRIVYGNGVAALTWQHLPYLICTCVPLFVSSHRVIRLFGAAVLVGFVVSAALYLAAFVSVWCFFAAANSTLLYFYFRQTAFAVRQA